MKPNHKTFEEISITCFIIKLLKVSNKGGHTQRARGRKALYTESSKDEYVNSFIVRNNEWKQEANGTMSLMCWGGGEGCQISENIFQN